MAQASVSLDTGATLDGRALARTGAVTLLSNSVVVPVYLPVHEVFGSEIGLRLVHYRAGWKSMISRY